MKTNEEIFKHIKDGKEATLYSNTIGYLDIVGIHDYRHISSGHSVLIVYVSNNRQRLHTIVCGFDELNRSERYIIDLIKD